MVELERGMVFYRVRRINNRYYLIKEWYDAKERKKKTVSIGPCDKIEETVRSCGGWDLNPRRPTPSGPKPATRLKTASKVFPSLKTPSESEKSEFFKWCIQKGTSEETCKQYLGYLSKDLDTENKWSILAWKAFFKFKGLEDEWKKLKTKQSKPDLRIPTDDEVINTLKAACSTSEELCLVYRLLIESGARLSEIIKMLNEYDPSRLKDHKGFYTYALAHIRGRKYSFYIFSITKPRPLKCSENWVSNWAAKNKMVNPKYVRKWVATKMLGIGIPSEIVNFIQGRTPTSILEKNYLNLYSLAMQYYPKYLELLKKMNL